MDVAALYGGSTTRPEPIGEFIPKAPLTLNGIPLIDCSISNLARSAPLRSTQGRED